MSVELMRTLSVVSYIVAGVFFLIAAALFFLLNVPKLVGDLSGRTAKRAIKAIREQNEANGGNQVPPSSVNASRGKVTDKITPSGRIEKKSESNLVVAETEKFSTAKLAAEARETAVLHGGEEVPEGVQSMGGAEIYAGGDPGQTEVLVNSTSGETAVLVNSTAGETAVLSNNRAGETVVLSRMNAGETAVLSDWMPEQAQNSVQEDRGSFAIEVEMYFIGSAEQIE